MGIWEYRCPEGESLISISGELMLLTVFTDGSLRRLSPLDGSLLWSKGGTKTKQLMQRALENAQTRTRENMELAQNARVAERATLQKKNAAAKLRSVAPKIVEETILKNKADELSNLELTAAARREVFMSLKEAEHMPCIAMMSPKSRILLLRSLFSEESQSIVRQMSGEMKIETALEELEPRYGGTNGLKDVQLPKQYYTALSIKDEAVRNEKAACASVPIRCGEEKGFRESSESIDAGQGEMGAIFNIFVNTNTFWARRRPEGAAEGVTRGMFFIT